MADVPGGLRRRLAMALIVLAAAAAAVQGLGYWFAERWVERASLQGLLERELNHLIETDAAPTANADDAATLRYFRSLPGEALPAALSGLAPGWHERVLLDGRHYEALIRDAAPAGRAYLLYDISGIELRERRLILLFGVGVLGVSGVAFWMSRRLAARALAPLDAMVTEIRALNPESRGARLRLEGDPELRVIAEALNSYMHRLDEVIERERAFAAAASHELRTPLAVIAGATELLAEKSAGSPPLARIERAVAQAMLDLDALLALSRRGDVWPDSRLALERLLPQWAEPHLAQHSTRIDWRLAPVTVDAPKGSLHIIFGNLLRNALRAAGERGTVTVIGNGDGIEVLDDGPGIPLPELARVFEPHVRGRDGGTGIGLYVARALAQRQGWQLTLANREGGGARAVLHWRRPGNGKPATEALQTNNPAVSIK